MKSLKWKEHWPANTDVVFGNKDNFNWLLDDMALLAGEQKLAWVSDAVAVREDRNAPD